MPYTISENNNDYNDSNSELATDNVEDDSYSEKDTGLEVYDYKTGLPAIENEDYEIDKEANYFVLILGPNSTKVINKDLLVKGSTNNCKISVRNISGTVVFDNVNIDLSNIHVNFPPSCLDFDPVKLHFIGNNIFIAPENNNSAIHGIAKATISGDSCDSSILTCKSTNNYSFPTIWLENGENVNIENLTINSETNDKSSFVCDTNLNLSNCSINSKSVYGYGITVGEKLNVSQSTIKGSGIQALEKLILDNSNLDISTTVSDGLFSNGQICINNSTCIINTVSDALFFSCIHTVDTDGIKDWGIKINNSNLYATSNYIPFLCETKNEERMQFPNIDLQNIVSITGSVNPNESIENLSKNLIIKKTIIDDTFLCFLDFSDTSKNSLDNFPKTIYIKKVEVNPPVPPEPPANPAADNGNINADSYSSAQTGDTCYTIFYILCSVVFVMTIVLTYLKFWTKSSNKLLIKCLGR